MFIIVLHLCTMKKLRSFFKLIKSIFLMIVIYLPGPSGVWLRYRFWRKRLKKIGERVRIDEGVYFENPGYIELEDNCWIDRNVIILAGKDRFGREKYKIENPDYKGEPGVVHVGRNVHIAPNCIISGISMGVYISDDCGIAADCKIYAFSHHYRSMKNPTDTNIYFSPLVPVDRQCIIEGSIFIGRNVGIALNSIILPGVSLPENCFVMINSVLYGRTKYKENSIISEHLPKKIGKRFLVDE